MIHRRMRHYSFSLLERLYPSEYEKADKQKLVCDGYEFGKHTMSSYVSSGSRSSHAFDLVHSDVWGPCPMTTVNGFRYFVSFIDYFYRVTWIYLMKNKSDMVACFKDFHKGVQAQYGEVVKVLRSDNGTEYTNRAFGEYLSSQGIHHQTTCPYTPEQNGVAEWKNRHLLEVTRSMMISMNVPKHLWGQAVLTAAQLINRMPSRVSDWHNPCVMLKGDNEGILPPKVFSYVCFVKDNKPNIGKLDSRAVRCIFVGYSATQKGYVCWSPVERRLFVSMDVTFREFEPYCSSETTSPFGGSLDTRCMRRDGESSSDGERRMVSVGGIPCPLVDSARVEPKKEDSARVEPEKENSERVESQREDSARVEPQREDSARI